MYIYYRASVCDSSLCLEVHNDIVYLLYSVIVEMFTKCSCDMNN